MEGDINIGKVTLRDVKRAQHEASARGVTLRVVKDDWENLPETEHNKAWETKEKFWDEQLEKIKKGGCRR